MWLLAMALAIPIRFYTFGRFDLINDFFDCSGASLFIALPYGFVMWLTKK